ncbi:MAG: 50S ribosomal protein L1 [Candidatus Margulisiibacteriota bacterium]
MTSKKYGEKIKIIDREKRYLLDEAVALLPKTTWTKFVETVDMSIKLGVDTAKNPSIRGTVSLPAGSGKTKKIAVITTPARVEEAKEAGADVAGSDDLIEKIKGGFLDFDIVIASPDMMASVGKVGKILGTKGLMPNPKLGTVTPDIKNAVKEFKTGKVEFRIDKGGVVALGIGKVNFPPAEIKKNFNSVLSALLKVKPSGLKGAYVKSITLSTTMGPGIKVNARDAVEELQ